MRSEGAGLAEDLLPGDPVNVPFTCEAIVTQLAAAGVTPFVRSVTAHEATGDDCAHVFGAIDAAGAVTHLVHHRSFRVAPAKLHADVGFPRVEFRGLGGAFGEGSLQVVIGPDGFYADIDRWNPLESVTGLLKHNAFEVWLPRWLRRKK